MGRVRRATQCGLTALPSRPGLGVAELVPLACQASAATSVPAILQVGQGPGCPCALQLPGLTRKKAEAMVNK